MTIAPKVQNLFLVIFLVLISLNFSCTKDYFLARPDGYSHHTPTDQTYRAILPLKITYLSPTDTRASITVLINGAPVDVLFDTGSWGLRVISGAIKGIQIDTDKETVSYGYSGGVGFEGKVAGAYLTMGRLQSKSPVKFMLIDQTNRNGGKYYPTGDSTMSNNGLTKGFNGIVGVGLRFATNQDGVANPLVQMPGNGAFIIHFPQFNSSDQGVVILNPSEQDKIGFAYVKLQPDSVLLPDGFNSWLDDQLKGTITVNGIPYTNNTLLDSGNPSDYYYNIASHDHSLGADTVIKLSLAGPPVETMFTTKNRISGQELIAVNNERIRNVFGIQFFFDFDVLYDQKNGLIGIRKRIN